MFRNNKDIQVLNIFNHVFLCKAYADDTMSFLENKELVKTFTLFSSCLRPKGVEMAVCGIQLVDLTRDAINILCIYFLHN